MGSRYRPAEMIGTNRPHHNAQDATALSCCAFVVLPPLVRAACSLKIRVGSVLGSQFVDAQLGLRQTRLDIPAARSPTERANSHLLVFGTLLAVCDE
jgi:hypothetical protein